MLSLQLLLGTRAREVSRLCLNKLFGRVRELEMFDSAVGDFSRSIGRD